MLYVDIPSSKECFSRTIRIRPRRYFGPIELLLINFESSLKGTIDEDGMISLSEAGNGYEIIDEISKRAIATGAKMLVVRGEDLPSGTDLYAILRYPL